MVRYAVVVYDELVGAKKKKVKGKTGRSISALSKGF